MGNDLLLHTPEGSVSYVEWQNYVIEPLRLNGVPGGSIHMKVDGSSTPQIFTYLSPVGFDVLCHRVNVLIIDAAACNSDDFGAGPPLDTGIDVVMVKGTDVARTYTAEPIKRNGEFGLLAGTDVRHIPGDRGLAVRWTLSKATGGSPIRIPEGYGIALRINDNLTANGIIDFIAHVQGVKVGK